MTSPFASVIGHERIISYLSRANSSGRLAHAYLFEGMEHLGKMTVAEIFASLLLGLEEGKKDKLYAHPDFLFLDLKADPKTGRLKKNIGIEDVRELTHRLTLSSMTGGAKVAIIGSADTLSVEAANAMLKTLEEPARRTFLILVARTKESLPKTVISRLQIMRFTGVPYEIVEKGLTIRGVKEKLAQTVSKLSFGRPGVALTLSLDTNSVGLYGEDVKRDLSLMSGPLLARFKFVEKFVSDKSLDSREMAAVILDRFELLLRDMLGLRLGAREIILNDFAEEEMAARARSFSSRDLLWRLKNVAATRAVISENISPRWALENFFLNL